MDRRFEKYFLKKAALDRWPLRSDSLEAIERVVVIPALAESTSLFQTLEDLGKNSFDLLSTTLVICVINNRPPGHRVEEDYEDNQKTLREIAKSDLSPLRMGVIDASSPGLELGEKEGVGSARKIGMDWGAHQLLDQGLVNGPLISLDADCRVPSDFLHAIDSFFQEEKRWAVVVEYAHPIGDEVVVGCLRGILAYETHLRYHELGLLYAGSPYAHPTIGSTIICTPQAYVTCGGMRKKRAAEDFYFLQELAKTGSVDFLTDTVAMPAARASDRVPFGTGRSIGSFLESEEGHYQTYSPESYRILKEWLNAMAGGMDHTSDEWMNLAKNISSDLFTYLSERDFPSAWERIRGQTKSSDRRLREFHRWFDAFRTLKAIHYLRDKSLGTSALFPALSKLLGWMGIEAPFPMEEISPWDVEKQREILKFLRKTMREMRR